jgi:amino acid transporter
LKPSPLTEASAVLAVAILGILLTFALSTMSIETGFAMLSNSALIFLLPAFTFWAVIGLFVRRKSKTFRLLVNIAVTAAVTVFSSSLLISAIVASSAGTLVERQQTRDVVSGLALVTFFSCLVGALVTYLWLLRAERAK